MLLQIMLIVFKPEVQDYIEQRMHDIAKGLEQLFNIEIELIYTSFTRRSY